MWISQPTAQKQPAAGADGGGCGNGGGSSGTCWTAPAPAPCALVGARSDASMMSSGSYQPTEFALMMACDNLQACGQPRAATPGAPRRGPLHRLASGPDAAPGAGGDGGARSGRHGRVAAQEGQLRARRASPYRASRHADDRAPAKRAGGPGPSAFAASPIAAAPPADDSAAPMDCGAAAGAARARSPGGNSDSDSSDSGGSDGASSAASSDGACELGGAPGWFRRCRGCGWLTAYERALRREEVPFCKRCEAAYEGADPDKRAALVDSLLHVHAAWSAAGL
ncbi:hypothetical protein Rsub_10597 [Raphidocelis subcapitata]|uniref:Uncharacterized protein n=1 Tax=Raphidocelis subcapitata TaxID=307507 RepID=A0A2V0PDJ8_9CHLO|nr:hypothetical protein Rsub_10597 [Raphidocelis subcapitata]|eukprot:GBF97924.1 hypothetical protein Rsub_10597 [Raphidocelis subcapitata]